MQTGLGMSVFRHAPASQYNVVLKERVMFHVINDEHVRGMHFHAPKPKAIPFEPPIVRIPAFPNITQTSLKAMQPGVFFVEYGCDKHCRSLGICVHYQFVIGGKKCPDGLVCQSCKQGVEHVPIKATRKCPMHYRPAELKPIGSRPEDFLATNEQFKACSEILRRSIENDWNDLVPKGRGRLRAREGTVDTANHKHQERTPRTINDVRKLSEDGADDSGYSSWHSSFSEKDLGYSNLEHSLLNQRAGVSYAEFTGELDREAAVMEEEYENRIPI